MTKAHAYQWSLFGANGYLVEQDADRIKVTEGEIQFLDSDGAVLRTIQNDRVIHISAYPNSGGYPGIALSNHPHAWLPLR